MMSERHSDPTERERRRSLASEVLAHLSGSQIDGLAMVLAQAYLRGQTPQEAAVDAAVYLDKPDPIPNAGPTMQAVPWAQTEARLEAQREVIPDAGPTDADLRGEVTHE